MDTISKHAPKATEHLIKTHMALVKQLARGLLSRLPDSVLLDDLIQAGMLGLLDAAQRFDASKGASFETYASIRIRGSMLDEIRQYDWVPRSVHRQARLIEKTAHDIENNAGRGAQDVEIAEALHIDIAQYHHLKRDAAEGKIQEWEEDARLDPDFIAQHTQQENPEISTIASCTYQSIKQSMRNLPQRASMVLILYYEYDRNLKEIADILNVTESRVSQLLTQAITLMRKKTTYYR